MRFAVTGEWSRNQLLRLIIVLFLIFIVGFCVVNALLFFAHMSFSYEGVVAHYLGKPGPFGEPAIPRSYKVLLEVSHGHLFAMAILAMTMSHLLLFVPAPPRLKLVLVITTFTASLLNEASSWLIRYVSPDFAYLKLSMFALLELSLLGISVMLLVAIFSKSRNAYRDTDPTNKRQPANHPARREATCAK